MNFGHDANVVKLVRVLDLQGLDCDSVVDLVVIIGKLRLLSEVELEVGQAKEGV